MTGNLGAPLELTLIEIEDFPNTESEGQESYADVYARDPILSGLPLDLEGPQLDIPIQFLATTEMA